MPGEALAPHLEGMIADGILMDQGDVVMHVELS
jgi:hypothetical protein